MPSKASKAQPVALRVELLDIDPLVWRRIIVANHWTLASLHHYLQWVMGWSDTHAHEFHAGDQVAAPEWWIKEIGFDNDTANYRNERRISVGALVAELDRANEFEYRYDMGDGWRHRIVVETVPAAWREFELPLQFARLANTPAHQRMSAARMAIKVSAPPSATLSMRSSPLC